MITFLPVDSKARKDLPVATGVVDYFPRSLVAIAELSRIGNDKHNPGEPLHWARGKGGNNADELMRHFIERGTIDGDDGVLHSTKVAWRALAILELELEAIAAKAKPKPLIDEYADLGERLNAAPGKTTHTTGRHPGLDAPYGGQAVLCGFDHGKHYPGVNYACAKCHCTVGDELRPAGCKHWITEARRPRRPKGMGRCPSCGAGEGMPHGNSCAVA